MIDADHRHRTPSNRTLAGLARRVALTDLVMVTAAVYFSQWERFGATGGPEAITFGHLDYTDLSIGLIIAWMVSLWAFRSRDRSVLSSGWEEPVRIWYASFTLFGFFGIASFVFQLHISRAYMFVSFPVGFVALIAGRLLWRMWLRRARLGGNFKNSVVVVGCSDDVVAAVAALERARGGELVTGGVGILGPFDELTPKLQKDATSVTTPADVRDLALRLKADSVLVAGNPAGVTFVRDLSWVLEPTSVDLLLSPHLLTIAGPRLLVRATERLSYVHVVAPSFTGSKFLRKRIIDVVASSLALVLIAPLFIAISALVHFEDRGPVFFRQTRIGRGGKPFTIVKFRSMVPSADRDQLVLQGNNDADGPLFKLRDDPRVTRIGGFLRRFSLDELPQFINIFRGDMSLVGPRPPLPSEVERYDQAVARRLLVKPGLTGLWQVNGRSDLAWEDGLLLDLYYVESWTLAGDIDIIFRTIGSVLERRGAY
jgi:exopolysaccharide biosynthesis polyprenyl glycosylphosphotransferase